MSQQQLTKTEMAALEEAMSADSRAVALRLREGEYQYDLAKAIASFQLELCFPDVKDIIKRLYGEGRANDIQFVRKTQTILKKMVKSNVAVILLKKRPWELQRYALSSFRFQDSDKNLIVLATDQEIKQSESLLHSVSRGRQATEAQLGGVSLKVFMVILAISVFYIISIWALIQPIINVTIFLPAFSSAIVFSVLLGKMLSQE
jgi:hypothetical protein